MDPSSRPGPRPGASMSSRLQPMTLQEGVSPERRLMAPPKRVPRTESDEGHNYYQNGGSASARSPPVAHNNSEPRNKKQDLEEFTKEIIDLGRKLLISARNLADVASQEDAEEAFPGATRDVASVATTLIDFVSESTQVPIDMLADLLEAVRAVRDCILELCRAAKACISNPYDFLTQQRLQNCLQAIAVSIKAVVTAADELREDPKTKMIRIQEDARNAIQALGKMIVATKGTSQSEFVACVKNFASSVGKLLTCAKNRKLLDEEKEISELVSSVVNAAKAAYKSRNSIPHQEALTLVAKTLAEALKPFITKLQASYIPTSPMSSPPTLLAREASGTVPNWDTGSAPASTALARRGTVAGPAPASGGTLGKWSPTPPTPDYVNRARSMKLTEKEMSSLSSASLSSQSSFSEDSSGSETQALLILNLFMNSFPILKSSWEKMPQGERDKFMKELEKLAPESSHPLSRAFATARRNLQTSKDSPAGTRSKFGTKEDDLAFSELESLRNVQDFTEWKMKTLEISLKKKFNRILENPLEIADSSLEALKDVPEDQIVRNLLDLVGYFSKAVIDFILRTIFLARGGSTQIDEGFEEVIKTLWINVKKILILGKSTSVSTIPAFDKVVTSCLVLVEKAPTKGNADKFVRDVATTALANLVDTSLKKKLYNESNAVRVLAIHMISTINSTSVNKSHLPKAFTLQFCFIAKALVAAVGRLLDTLETCRDFENRRKQVGSDFIESEPEKTEGETQYQENRNINEEPELTAAEAKSITVGSLNKLVLALSSDANYDNRFLKTFITTYRSFTTPHKLFLKLVERYNVPRYSKADPKRVQLRVAVIIKYWVENQFVDFDDHLISLLNNFVEYRLAADGYKDVASILSTLIKKLSSEREEIMHHIISAPPTDLSIPEGKMSPFELFNALNDEEIARQLTVIDFMIYHMIEPSELLNQSWNKDKLKYRAFNVTNSLWRLNTLSFWVPSMILTQEKVKDRAKMFTKFVNIGEHLRKMNNFHTLMGLIAGLNLSSITRLRHTHAELTSKTNSSFKSLVKLMSIQGSFKNYRSALTSSKPPALPYLGCYLTDLTFMEDGNPDMIDGQINFKKRELVYERIQEIKLYQLVGYPFPHVEPIHTFLLELPYGGEKELYELSLFREPRDVERSQVE